MVSIDIDGAFRGTLAVADTVKPNSAVAIERFRRLGLRPMLDAPYMSVDITAVTSTGRKVTLLKLRNARPEWPRRYWLVDPIELPANTKIEVSMLPGDPDIGPLGKAESFPLQVGLDVVPQ